MQKTYLTTGPLQTKKLGENLAKEILQASFEKQAIAIGLEGDLGGGKTTFLQGFARGLGIKEKVLSPTFILMKKFQIPNPKLQNFYHIDCYRIQKPKEILGLGFREIISNPRNVVVIEWADRIKKNVPKNAVSLKFSFVDKNKRKIVIKNKNDW